MKEIYTAPTLELITVLSISPYSSSSDIFIEDNEGFSPVFRP